MAKVFLDANIFVDLVQGRGNVGLAEMLRGHNVWISALSVHVLFYVCRKKVPDGKIDGLVRELEVVSFSEGILLKSMKGQTDDLEDNIQLLSAIKAKCDLFLTSDKKLLRLRTVEGVMIVDKLA